MKFRHRLGTNNTGEDVAAGLIHGARISLSIGMIAMGIAACIGCCWVPLRVTLATKASE